jgi:acyl-CoA reductase-like NAD-dependent aldehyde dehydrogenase
LAELANAAIVDDGLKQGTKLGPLQNKMQYEKVKGYLDDARANGTIVAGGDAPDRPGYFIRPTIVRDIAEGTRLVDEEQFGPVLPLIKFSDPQDALRRANATSYGLARQSGLPTRRRLTTWPRRWRRARFGSTSTSTFFPTCLSAGLRIRELAESWVKRA